jgi:leucyl-tRNA---protein transferase
MLVQYYQPYALSPSRLDRYLASGWFRNSTLLFRSRVLCLDGEMLDVVNIRLPLQDYTFPGSMQKIKRRNQNRFRTEIGPACIDKAKNQLYHAYKKRFRGFIYPNLKQFLHSEGLHSVFDTRQIEVFDGDKLVAFSFFDIGQYSISSIIGVHDLSYSKYSLGMYTMLAEIEYGIHNQMRYYYPGFVFNRPSQFDYKLRLGEFQVYDWKNYCWVQRHRLNDDSFSGKIIIDKILLLEQHLESSGVHFSTKLYPYFSLGYIENRIEPFVKAPILLLFPGEDQEQVIIAEYLHEDGMFLLSQAACCPSFDYMLEQQMRMGGTQSHYKELNRVYKYSGLLAVSKCPEEMVTYILHHTGIV